MHHHETSTDPKQQNQSLSTEMDVLAEPLAGMAITNEKTEDEEEVLDLSTASMNNLELDRLKPRSVREQGFVQIKMVADHMDCGKLGSWKMYYAVLLSGFLLLYKGSYTKNKVRKVNRPDLVRLTRPISNLSDR